MTPAAVPVERKIAWSYREVCLVTGLSRTTIHKLLATGSFPKPREPVAGRRLFVAEEVRRWLAGQPAARED